MENVNELLDAIVAHLEDFAENCEGTCVETCADHHGKPKPGCTECALRALVIKYRPEYGLRDVDAECGRITQLEEALRACYGAVEDGDPKRVWDIVDEVLG
jgi:hypothetical protein